MALARQRIDECVHGHTCCQDLGSPNGTHRSRLPTRLLDCTDLAHPRLVSPNQGHAEYLALSYVWGEDQIHKTTRSNLSTYERGIEPSLLPATIRDAIRVTHMLGFRWLWVDSLCILQDSDKDKLHEVGRMHHIYRYAHLTIIAASANKASEGFLHTRSPPEDEIVLPFICPPDALASTGCRDIHSLAQPQSGTVCFAPESLARSTYSDDNGLMCKRAWCMQEYLVSPRSLIFTPRTLHFRCLAGMRGIGEGSLCPAYDKPRIPQTLFLQDLPIAKLGSPEWIDMHEAWLEVVSDYSTRTASDESDKLVACAAVAEQFHRVLRSDYLAGLWRSDVLLIDLLWTTVKPENPSPGLPSHTRPTAYRAPSWSWAAIEGDVTQSFQTMSYYKGGGVALANIVECRVTLPDAELPFGRVTSGTLVLSGTLIPYHGAILTKTFPVFPDREYYYPWLAPLPSLEQVRRHQKRVYGDLDDDGEEDDWIEGGRLNFCIDCDSDAYAIGEIWVVPVVRFKFGPCGDQWVHGLVLTMAPPSNSSGSEHERTRFRRVGVFEADATASHGLGHTLWDPLTQAMQDGEWPLVDIEIV